jgi:uncharacterized protein (DUF4415 family)
MPKKQRHIVTTKLDPAKPRPLTRQQRAEIAALSKMPDREIDYSDIPRIPSSLLERAVRGGLYRPVKRQLSVRIDADVLVWLKSHGKGYHSRLNNILRSAMVEELRFSS